MIFCDKCFNCSNYSVLLTECDSAKQFWQKYHVGYIFSCGAYFNPELGFNEVHSMYCKYPLHTQPSYSSHTSFSKHDLQKWAHIIVLSSFCYPDLCSIIQHLKVEHELSFEQIQATINHIDHMVDSPGTSPFDGWEKYY